MFELVKVTASFGERKILDAVSMPLGPEPVAIVGPSGSGKTTLLRLLAGQLRAGRGRVLLDGRQVRASRHGGGDPRVAVIHQDYRLVEFLSALDNVLLACELRGSLHTEHEARALLDRVGLRGDVLDRRPGHLSGGEQQRVAIARALLSGATALVADEPTGALDASATTQITDLLLDLATTHRVQVVIATHDQAVAGRMGRAMRLGDGVLAPVPTTAPR